jgi:hypothetical protein
MRDDLYIFKRVGGAVEGSGINKNMEGRRMEGTTVCEGPVGNKVE